MAWTALKTWVVGDVLPAADFNTYVRDNLSTSPNGISTGIGDLTYASAANTLSRLGIGSALQLLRVNSTTTAPEWAPVPEVTVPLAFNVAETAGTYESVGGYRFAYASAEFPTGFTATFTVLWSATNAAGGTDNAEVGLRDITSTGDLWNSGAISVPVTNRLDSNTVVPVDGRTYEVYARGEQGGQALTIHNAVLRFRW